MKNKHPIIRVYRFFKSIKLALALIGYLVVTSIIASLIPQGREMSFYAHEFSAPIYKLIITLKLNNFFRSILFLIPLGLFTINLSVCTIDRLVTRIKHHAPLRLGPDIIHIGLLVLIIAGSISLLSRQEGFVFLSPGDSLKLPNGYELTLKKFVYEAYPDERPKMWISEVEITEQSQQGQSKTSTTETEHQIATIEVNRPLKLGGLNIFQYSYKDISTITLKSPSGSTVTLHTGKNFRTENSVYRFIKVSTDPRGFTTIATPRKTTIPSEKAKRYAVFLIPSDDSATSDTNTIRFITLPLGTKLGEYTIDRITLRLESGLNVVYDPGFVPIIAGLVLVGFGLTLTLIQKIGDNKL